MNFDAWLAAIRAAQSLVLLDNYIFRDDATGREFRDALAERAGAGVKVCVIRDWMGCLGQSSVAFWQPLVAAGGEVRTYNPLHFTSPFGWLSRDHRKLLVVDNTVAFVGGICVSGTWLGDPERGIDPWRDTAVGVRGPALRDLANAFADTLVDARRKPAGRSPRIDRSLPASRARWIFAWSRPCRTRRACIDSISSSPRWRAARCGSPTRISSASRRTFKRSRRPRATASTCACSCRAPATFPPWPAISRAGYRPLLEAGVRVFEWNGSMLHAKTAVADGRWARVGSSNLNLASWIGNCELDIAVEDEAFARCMEAQYETDLGNATEHRQVPGPTRTALPTTAQRRPTDHQNTSAPALDTLQRNLSRRSRSSPMRAA